MLRVSSHIIYPQYEELEARRSGLLYIVIIIHARFISCHRLSIYFTGSPQKIARLNLSCATHLLLVCVGLRTLCTHARTLLLPRRCCKRVPANTITSSGIAGTEMNEASSPMSSLLIFSVDQRSAISSPSDASVARTKIVNVPLSL